MYIVDSGTLACTKIFAGTTQPTFLKEYHAGESFGELSLLYNTPRAASITASSSSILWKLDRETFNHIVRDAAMAKRARFEQYLNNIKLISEHMQPYERSKLADAL
jgi:cAMP-dependent protein kinase regulator